MKRALLLCVIGMAALDSHAATSNPPQPVMPFSAVVWTTKTLHSPAGKPFTFMQRTLYTRDASGTVRREIYQPTKGLQHDTTAPLERVLTGSTSAHALPDVQLSKGTVEQDVDLATGNFPVFQLREGSRHSRTAMVNAPTHWRRGFAQAWD